VDILQWLSKTQCPKFAVNGCALKTPKALANFSPGLERSDNPGCKHKEDNKP
jgi:hypothetical protein